MSIDFIENLRFFVPSKLLTVKLLDSIEELRQRDLEEIKTDPEQVASDEEMQVLCASEAYHLDEAFDEEVRLPDERVAVDLFQKRIAEELYYHLAFLARTEDEGKTLSTRQCIIQGMSMALGLPETDPLLLTLADEFSQWVDQKGEFVAGWGTVISAEGEGIYLTLSAATEEELANASSSFVVPYPPNHRRSDRAVDRARGAGNS